jgi:predicted  nucleic acid-binding Zn-ribbon protein
MLDIICTKCNHVLDLETEPDIGECPKCGGSMYQQGDVFDEELTPSQQNTLDLMSKIQTSRISNKSKKLVN